MCSFPRKGVSLTSTLNQRSGRSPETEGRDESAQLQQEPKLTESTRSATLFSLSFSRQTKPESTQPFLPHYLFLPLLPLSLLVYSFTITISSLFCTLFRLFTTSKSDGPLSSTSPSSSSPPPLLSSSLPVSLPYLQIARASRFFLGLLHKNLTPSLARTRVRF